MNAETKKSSEVEAKEPQTSEKENSYKQWT